MKRCTKIPIQAVRHFDQQGKAGHGTVSASPLTEDGQVIAVKFGVRGMLWKFQPPSR
jgi:hypothetical protein